MRDRLIKLLEESSKKAGEHIDKCNHTPSADEIHELRADYLLAKGAIVPPCKIGDKVYLVGRITKQIVSLKVVAISISENDCFLHLENGTWITCNQHIGKTVFLTREEAKAKLKEGVQG